MAQNRSSAVMEQRAHRAPDSLDYFPTAPWATRALCEFLQLQGMDLGQLSVWEPACGEMHMARPLFEYFGHVRASDVFRYSDDHGICDFLTDGRTRSRMDVIATNPPFVHAEQFLDIALGRARRAVAMLVRSAWLEGGGRYREIFAPDQRPPSYVLQFAERVVMLEGRLIQTGAPDPFNLDEAGKPRKASSATSYSWCIWLADSPPGQLRVTWNHDTRHRWIAPSRTLLERPGDYPDYSALLREIEARAQAQQGGNGATLFDGRT